MVQNNYHVPYYFTSVSSIFNLPSAHLSVEVAFVGYSNSGKSSVINTITNSKKLTKISRIPGSTKYINLFEIKPGIRFIDFPGYGYSKNIKIRKEYWYNVICQYLNSRKNLKGLTLIMDVRHAIKYLDHKIIEYVLELNIPILVLLNKSDKISKDVQKKRLCLIQNKIDRMSLSFKHVQVEIFSSVKKYGIESVNKIISFWL